VAVAVVVAHEDSDVRFGRFVVTCLQRCVSRESDAPVRQMRSRVRCCTGSLGGLAGAPMAAERDRVGVVLYGLQRG